MPEKKPWAVFVYLVADDQRGSPAPALDDIAERELDLMFEAVDRRNVHVAVQVDFRNKKEVWRYLRREPEGSLPESSAGDPRTIKTFLDWASDNTRAERHLVLFWGHAFGTAGLFPDSRPEAPLSRDILSLPELSDVLSHASALFGGQAVDIVMFKNCCLSNVETAYQLHADAEFMLASQSRLPAKGWPYDRLFSTLVAEGGPETSTERLARRLVRHLAEYYAETEPARDVPTTLLRLEAARHLRDPFRRLSAELARAHSSEAVRWGSAVHDALRRAAYVGDPALPDVVNLCRHLRDPIAPYDRAIAEAAQRVEHVVNRQLVLSHFSKSSAFNGAGVFYRPIDQATRQDSIVANAVDLSEYLSLAFCEDTNWSEIALGMGPAGPLTLNRRAAITASSWR
jgi:hypothetical protein